MFLRIAETVLEDQVSEFTDENVEISTNFNKCHALYPLHVLNSVLPYNQMSRIRLIIAAVYEIMF